LRLTQVVSNLLNNAAKYTPPGGHIRLTLWQDGEAALLAVRDDGIGIAPEDIRGIFDLFRQVPAGRDHSNGGLGVGLTLVKRLVELHGGRVDARSAGPQKGTEFIVRLPAPRSQAVFGVSSRPAPTPTAHFP
jgi:signal transduction histidine kinase